MNRNLSSIPRTPVLRGLARIGAGLLVASAIGCGANAGAGGASPGAPADIFAGHYQATWSGVWTTDGEAPVNATGAATMTVSAEDDQDILMTWQIADAPPSGSITFVVSGSVATATGIATGGSCYAGALSNGDQATVCATTAAANIDGDTLTQTQTGTFTGVNAQGAPVTGTYSGMWTGIRIP
jgi:hypothetical protein